MNLHDKFGALLQMLSLIMIGPATLCWMLKGNAAENCVVSMDTIQRERSLAGGMEEGRETRTGWVDNVGQLGK